MIVSQRDIALIGGRHAVRARRKLRAVFVQTGADAEARGHYFDRFILMAEGIIGSRDSDHLMLLELGWQQGVGLDGCAQFQEVTRRGKWYGRRLWLEDQLDRVMGREGGV